MDIVKDVPGTWSITVDDSTEGSLWTGSVAYSAPETSAEWIEEAPTDADTGNVELLADYGSVHFSDMGVRGTGTGRAAASPVYMVKQGSSNAVQSYPAPYDRATDSFNVTYGIPSTLPNSFPAVHIVTGAGPTTTSPTTTSPTTTSPPTTSPTTTPTSTSTSTSTSTRYHGHAYQHHQGATCLLWHPRLGHAAATSTGRPRVLARGQRRRGFRLRGRPVPWFYGGHGDQGQGPCPEPGGRVGYSADG